MSAKVRQHIPASSVGAATPRTGFKTPRPGLVSPRLAETPREISKELAAVGPIQIMRRGGAGAEETWSEFSVPGPQGQGQDIPQSLNGWSISRLDCMLYSAMFVHIHPKKQPRAFDMLSIRHDRAVCETVLRILQEEGQRSIWYRNRKDKALQHRRTRIESKTVQTWKFTARHLKISQLRLRSTVERWLRQNAEKAFNIWTAEMGRLAVIGKGLDRLLTGSAFRCRVACFQAWVEDVDLQVHRKNVLTRIVLRIQDRGLTKGLRQWSDVSSTSAARKLQGNFLAHRHRSAILKGTFNSWQHLRQKGLKAIRLIDTSSAKWNKIVKGVFFDSIRQGVLWRRLCRVRSKSIAASCARLLRMNSIKSWRCFQADRHRLKTVGHIIAWKALKGIKIRTFDSMQRAIKEGIVFHAIKTRVIARIVRIQLNACFQYWFNEVAYTKVLRTSTTRALIRHAISLLRNFFEIWTFGNGLATQILALHERAISRQRRNLLGSVLTSWSARAGLDSAVRNAGNLSYVLGIGIGKRQTFTSFKGWMRATRERRKVLASVRMVFDRQTKSAAVLSWADAARKNVMQGQRFHHILACSDFRLTRTIFGTWVAIHLKTMRFGKALLQNMQRWEKIRLRGLFGDWGMFSKNHKTLRVMNRRLVYKFRSGLLSNLISIWHFFTTKKCLLRRRSSRHAMERIKGIANGIFSSWIELTAAKRIQENKIFRLKTHHLDSLLLRYIQEWFQTVKQTSLDTLIVERKLSKKCFLTSGSCLLEWSHYVRLLNSKKTKLSLHVWNSEQETCRKSIEIWAVSVQRILDLRELRNRCAVHLTNHAVEETFWCWCQASTSRKLLAVKQRIVMQKSSRSFNCSVLFTWRTQAHNARKLRSGLSKLIINQQDRYLSTTFVVWVNTASSLARMHRTLRSLILRRKILCSRDVFFEWTKLKTFSKRAGTVIIAARAKIIGKQTLTLFRVWEKYFRQIQYDVVFSSRLKVQRSRTLLTSTIANWRQTTILSKMWSERSGRLALCKKQVAISNIVFGWFRLVRSEKLRLDGLDRCVVRWMNRMLRHALDRWGEMAMYLKRMNHSALVLKTRREKSQCMETVLTLLHQKRSGLKLHRQVLSKTSSLLNCLMEEWKYIASNMIRKRRDLSRLVVRLAHGALRLALIGWSEESRRSMQGKSRRTLVESRCISSRTKASISVMIQNVRYSKRYRRQRSAFDRRWQMTRLKNSCDCWRQWHQKKMAVKGVLDQVAEMM